MFQQNINKILKYLPNAFGITDDILVIGHDADGREKTRCIMSFQVHQDTILWESIIQRRSATRHKEAVYAK